jgi:hypothetical protein
MRDIGKYEYEIPFCSRPPPGIPPFPGSRYDPPLNKEDIFLPWAEFADPVMLDRMAQFYQDYSIRSPLVNYDNTISYDIITKFLGVAASSAYSCDVICELTTITYDPYTGCKYKEEKLVDSFGDNLHDRRFYFYKDPAKVDQVVPGTSWKEGKGLLTVVGCTNSDGTAPDAWNGISLPKIFNVGLKPLTKSMREVLGSSAFWKNLGASVGQNTSMVVGMGTMSVQQLTNADMTFHDPQTNRENEVYVGNERVLIYDYYNINIGPDIGKSTGYVPTGQIACRKTTITPAQCALPSYLQSVVNQYHATNPKKHLKTITSIQTWGKAIPENQTNEYHYPSNSSKQTLDVSGPYQTYGDACYYGGYEADYDPMTNLETNIRPAQILVKNYHDTSVNKNSCVFLIDTKNTFLDINTAGYKPIDLRDPVLKRTMAARKYPFSKVVEIPPPIPPGNQITKALLDRLVSTFNATHVSKGRQIIRVLRTWQPTIDKARVDMEVEMMRSTAVETKQLGTKPYTIPKQPTVLKETVRFTLTPTLDDYLSDGSDVLNSGAFIQRNTPPSLNDISGGILSLRSSMDSFGSSVQKLVAPLLNIGASQKVLTASQNAKTATDSALERLYVSQTLKDPCSALKCSDPDLLNAIVARYNEDNLPPPGVQFGVKTQQMVQVLKVGVASPNQCDILFNNRIEEYDSLMNNPIRVSNVAKAMRFTLDIPAGQTCTYSINRTYVDVSSTAIGLRSDLEQSQLVSFYSAPQCSIDYRSAEIRGALKLKLSAFDSASAISSWKTILASYSPTPTQCEYKVLKDYTVYSPPPTKTTTNVESYLLATFTIDQQCRATLQSVKEIIPTQLDIRLDTRTGVRTPYLNGQPVILPALFSYDTSVPSQRVNSASSPF